MELQRDHHALDHHVAILRRLLDRRVQLAAIRALEVSEGDDHDLAGLLHFSNRGR